MKYLAMFALLWLGGPPAMAYIDPGTGMIAIQGLIALVIGVVAFVKHPIQSMRRLLRRVFGKRDDGA